MVSGCVGFLGVFALTVRAVSVADGPFRAQSFKNLSSGDATVAIAIAADAVGRGRPGRRCPCRLRGSTRRTETD